MLWHNFEVETKPHFSPTLVSTADEAPRTAQIWFLLIATAAVGVVVSAASGTHIALGLIMVPLLITIAMLSPKGLLLMLAVWLAELGLIRRLVPGGGNSTFSGDPLLIVGPAIIFFLFVVAANRGALHNKTKLGKLVYAWIILCLLEAINPLQGGLTVGLGGLLFIMVPMLVFWVGRGLLDDVTALKMVKLVRWLGLGAAAYGIYQQSVKFPSWDASWLQTNAYTALSVGNGVTRAFGSSSSAQEYATFLGCGLIAWVASLKKEDRTFLPVHLFAIGVISYAIYYEAQRTALFLAVLGVGVVIGASRNLRPRGVLLAGVLAIAALMVFAGQIGTSTPCAQGDAACTLSQRQASGVANPLGQSSSLSGHFSETQKGVIAGVTHPLGRGTGSVTLAAGKFASAQHARGTEFDPGNAGQAFGLAGLVMYTLLLIYALQLAYRVAVRRHDAVGYFALGLLCVDLFQWLNGDLYSVTWLVWLMLGWLDAEQLRASAAQGEHGAVLLPAAILLHPAGASDAEPVHPAHVTNLEGNSAGPGRQRRFKTSS